MDQLKDDFFALGMVLAQNYEKTAAEKAGEDLFLDAYVAGVEAGLGIPEAHEAYTKLACQQLGRAIMSDFVPSMLLNK